MSGSWGMSERDTLFFTGGKLVGYPVDKPSSVLESPSDARRGDADGNMAVFVAPPRLRGYLDDGKAGIQTLVETMPSYPHHAAVSPTRIVAVLGDESFPGSDSGSFSALRLWHGPRSLEDLSLKGELIELPFHPPGDGTLAPHEIKTWGDWAATKVGWYDAKGLPKTTYLVAHLPGKKSWAVLPIPGYQFERFYTLDDTHLYINGIAVTAPYASRLWRISLADLDAFTAGQTPL